MANNYKVKMKDIQNKYKFKIFCAGYEYDDTEIKQDILELQGDVSDLETAVSQKALISETGRYIELELNSSTYVLTAKLYDKNNNLISSSTPIDLPLESMIVNATYDSTTKSLIITLQNGNTTSIPLGDLISGLATEEDLNEVRDNLEVVQKELNQYKTIYNVLPKVNGSSEALTLSDTGNATLKMDLKGNTSQSGEPTPDAPIPVNVVSGDNTIDICGKNLLKTTNTNISDTTYSLNINNGLINITTTGSNNSFDLCNGTRTGQWLPASYSDANDYHLTPANQETYILSVQNVEKTISGSANQTLNVYTNQRRIQVAISPSGTIGNTTIILEENEYIKSIYLWTNGSSNITKLEFNLQLEKGSTATTYEPYQEQNYSVNLGTLELCKIGNYQDYIYKDNGKWYKYGAINKILITSDNTNIINAFGTQNEHTRIMINKADLGYQNAWGSGYCLMNNYHEATSVSQVESGAFATNFNLASVVIWNDSFSSLEDARTKLIGTEIYIIKATPTTEEITNATLISQLDALETAMSYKGQTNISQINNDAPFIIDATALKDLSSL